MRTPTIDQTRDAVRRVWTDAGFSSCPVAWHVDAPTDAVHRKSDGVSVRILSSWTDAGPRAETIEVSQHGRVIGLGVDRRGPITADYLADMTAWAQARVATIESIVRVCSVCADCTPSAWCDHHAAARGAAGL